MLLTFTSTPIALTQGRISLTAPGDDIRMTMVVAEASYRELDRRGATLCRISRRLRETRPQFWCQKTDLLFYDFLIRLMCGPENGPRFGATERHHFRCRFLSRRHSFSKKAVPDCGPNCGADCVSIETQILCTVCLCFVIPARSEFIQSWSQWCVCGIGRIWCHV